MDLSRQLTIFNRVTLTKARKLSSHCIIVSSMSDIKISYKLYHIQVSNITDKYKFEEVLYALCAKFILHSSASLNFYCTRIGTRNTISTAFIAFRKTKANPHAGHWNCLKIEQWYVLCMKIPRCQRLQITYFSRQEFLFPLSET